MKERTKVVGLNINVEKTKTMVQNRRLRRTETLTVMDHNNEVVRRFNYLGTVINDIYDETEDI